jgi:hypothetical protein
LVDFQRTTRRYIPEDGTIKYLIHKSPSLVPTLSQINPAHKITYYFLKTNFNIILPSASSLCSVVSSFQISKTKIVCPFLISYSSDLSFSLGMFLHFSITSPHISQGFPWVPCFQTSSVCVVFSVLSPYRLEGGYQPYFSHEEGGFRLLWNTNNQSSDYELSQPIIPKFQFSQPGEPKMLCL